MATLSSVSVQILYLPTSATRTGFQKVPLELYAFPATSTCSSSMYHAAQSKGWTFALVGEQMALLDHICYRYDVELFFRCGGH